jgi:hypothetical protein
MTTPSTSDFAGPAWTDTLPLHWQAEAQLPDARTLEGLDEQNERVLRHCLALDEVRGDARDDDDESTPELLRLEAKLSAVLDMVAQLLAQSIQLPPLTQCVIHAAGMQWLAPDPPRIGDLLRVSFHPSRRYPQAVVVHARVAAVHAQPEGASVSVTFEGLGAAVRDELEKLIFRRHRRLVARSRRGG